MNDFHFNYYQARLHRAQYEFDRAEEFCVKALKSNPQHTGALSLYGNLKAIKGHHDEAREAFAAAAQIEPKNTILLVNLAAALKDMGDFDEARALLEKAIAIDKTFAPAYYTLAGIIRFKSGDPLIETYELLKKRVYGNTVYRCVACFSLGKIYNDIGEWDLAFENYAEGNHRRGARYDHRQTQNIFEAIKRVFTSCPSQRDSELGNQSSKPVFIIGMPRSGSSLIEELLSRSDGVAGLGEPHDIEDHFFASYKTSLTADNKVNLHSAIDSTQLNRLGETYLNRMGKLAPGAERMIDKNLFNHEMVGFIRLIFPNASIIHAKRDPIDTCLSCYFQNFTEGHEYSFELGDIAKRYVAYVDIMEHWETIYGREILTASYENMISNQKQQLEKLFDHIGLTAPEPEKFAQPAARAIPTASAWQARQPIYKTSLKRWKNYEKHLGPLFKVFDEAGYDYDGVG